MKKLMGIASIMVFVLGLGFAACDTSESNENDGEDVTTPGEDISVPEGDTGTGGGEDGGGCTPVCLLDDGVAPAECGNDGCDGSCGMCNPGIPCVNGECVCEVECDGKTCGPDGCGEYCGTGEGDQGCDDLAAECINGECIVCTPNCVEKQCGSDGCGGSCGTCPCDGCDPEEVDCIDGMCEPPPGCDCKCIFDCFETCPQGDQACSQNCVNSADIEGQMAYNNLITCLDQSGYFDCPEGDDECANAAFDQCMDPYYECFHGDLTCVEMNACLSACPEGDAGTECSQDCFSEGSVEALKTWDALVNCLDENGYFDCAEGDDECADAAFDLCMDEYYACFHGDLDCVDMFICVQSCPSGDQVCVNECFGSGTIEASQTWGLFLDCLDANGYFDCAEGDEACAEAAYEACDEELMACAHGDLACSEIIECMDTCAPTDQICILSCQVHGTVEAQNLLYAISDCVIEQCGEQPKPDCKNEAYTGACATLYTDCVGVE